MVGPSPPLHSVFSPSRQASQACSRSPSTTTHLSLLNLNLTSIDASLPYYSRTKDHLDISPASSTTALSQASSSIGLATDTAKFIKDHQLDFGALLTPVPSVVLDVINQSDRVCNKNEREVLDPSLLSPSLSPGLSVAAKDSKRASRIPSLFSRFRRSSNSVISRSSLATSHQNPRRASTPCLNSLNNFSDIDTLPRGSSSHQESCENVPPQTSCNREIHVVPSQAPAVNIDTSNLESGASLSNQDSDSKSLSSSVSPSNPKPHIQPQPPCRPPSRAASILSRRPSSLRRFATSRLLNNSSTYLSEKQFPTIFTSTAATRLSVPIDALRQLQSISEHDISRKMHQTSSRLLRMTEDERPFTRDFKDLFSTLMVSLPLTPHRVRFQRIDHTFTSEEAITNLGSLKFSQSNRMPDPKDPSRIVTTTTTTTFSMAREMAKSVCQKFLEARFIESVDGKNDFSSKNAVWQLTPKGMHILQRFCNRNGINQRHVQLLLESPRNTMHLVLLERESDGDRLYRDQATIEVVFRRFVGQDGPNLKWSTANSDSDSVTDYQTGLIGVKMARERKVGDKTYWNTFTGKAAVDWLMDCCTMVDRRETVELAGLFVEYGLIHPVEGTVQPGKFSPTKTSIYYVTDKGQRVAGWVPGARSASNGATAEPIPPRRAEGGRDSNANRMTVIIRDPALRLLFREFLRDTHCEENLAFYLDVKDFLSNYHTAKRASSTLRLDTIRETLAAAYSLYNAFLAPGSPCELNIDHSLRTALAARMTRAVGDDEATIASLDEVAGLFDQAQTSVFKLMASDSVPKFMREPKYAPVIRDRNLDIHIGQFAPRT